MEYKAEDFLAGSKGAATAMGLSLNEAVSRGLIKAKAAEFIVQRSGELFAVLVRGGSLTRDERGIYFEEKPKETKNDD